MFDRLGYSIVIIGEFPGTGADAQVGDHVYAGCFVFELYTGHAEHELVVGVGKAGKIVFIRPGQIVAVIEVGGTGDGQGRGWVGAGGVGLG